MIVSALSGGLGNQMFQCAAGVALALKNNSHFYVDAKACNKSMPQGYELARIFEFAPLEVSNAELSQLIGIRRISVVQRVLKKRIGKIFRGRNFVVEPNIKYWESFIFIPDNTYLVGYWQTEKYFHDIRDVIKDIFVFKNELIKDLDKYKFELQNCNSVSIHIRRGDYVSSCAANKFHGVCSVEYYMNAIEYISSKVHNSFFYNS